MRQLFALLCHSKVFKSTGLGQPKHVKLTGDSKLGAGVNGALSLSVLASYTANLSRLYPISSLFTAGINFSFSFSVRVQLKFMPLDKWEKNGWEKNGWTV